MGAHNRLPDIGDLGLGRRETLRRCGMGLGALALVDLISGAGMLTAASGAEENRQTGSHLPLAPRKPHFSARAKRVIHIFANGGPSHVDTLIPSRC